jgi:signal transduction histidine kinase
VNITTILLSVLLIFLSVLSLFFYFKLQKFKKDLIKREEAEKQQFYEIVHELRAPLTAVKDAAVLLNMSVSIPDEKRTQMLSLIKTECMRLLEQVSSVLDASKVMNKTLAIDKQPNDLNKLISEKILIYTPQAKAAGIELENQLDPLVSEVMYDSKLINEVMNNLISNSLKYTPTGGKITIQSELKDRSVVVSVFDNGMGIATDNQKQLFAKFATISAKTDKPSTGLGLYVVKGIIEAHGGTVTVDTQQNRGYKVSISLPLTTMPVSLGTPQAAHPAHTSPALT